MTATQAQAVEGPAAKTEERALAWTPSNKGWAARIVVLAVIFGGILVVTGIVPPYWADRIAKAAIWAIIGLSLNVVLGYVGQISLGHQGFIGIAAFVAAYYATEQAGCPTKSCSVGAFATATLFAILSAGLAAGLLGLVALRIRGLYLALITLTYAFMAERTIFEIGALTGGGAGMHASRPAGFTSDTAFAYLCILFLAVVLFIDWRVLRSKAGRAILSIKHSESVAASYGINVTGYKVFAFVLSGLFAGLAGSLFAFHATEVVANQFQFNIALSWVLMVVVGGLGNRTGVVIGSAFFALFEFLVELIGPLAHFIEEQDRTLGEFTIVFGALLALLTLIQYPGGIAEQLSPITRWLRGEKLSMHPEGHGHKKKREGSRLPGLGRRSPSGGAEGTNAPADELADTSDEPQPAEALAGTASGEETTTPATRKDDV